jgi:flagellar hook-associated protein 1 FlgK
MGLNAALGIAGRALEVFSAGIQVAGQNIANATTPGYIRENLLLGTGPPYQAGQLVLGTGVMAQGIVQQIDQFLQVRIHAANSDVGAADARNQIYAELQARINELGDDDLSTQVSDFLAALSGVANQPESEALRVQAVSQGAQLATFIGQLRGQIDEQRQAEDVQVQAKVDRANELIEQIVNLNPQISKLESSGLLRSQAGALRDQRYQALGELSEIIPIRYQELGNGAVDVFSGSDFLILTGKYQQLETVAFADRKVAVDNVRLSVTGTEISADSRGSGGLRGLLQGRDDILGSFVDRLDTLTSALIFEFNRMYSSGEGVQGFKSVTSVDAVNDPSAALNAAGLSFTPRHGSFDVKVRDAQTGMTTTTNVLVDLDGIGTDTSLTSLAAAINAIGNVSASVTADGHLTLSAASGYEIRFGNDTSDALAALGINTFFTGNDSSTIGINSALAGNAGLFAWGGGGGGGGGGAPPRPTAPTRWPCLSSPSPRCKRWAGKISTPITTP